MQKTDTDKLNTAIMIAEVQQQIEHVDRLLRQLQNVPPDDYAQKFIQLMNCRKDLRRIAEAEAQNPGIATLYASEDGKCGLVNSFLSCNGKPFAISANGKQYDYRTTIPLAKVGVIRRFSSFNRHPEDYNGDLPVVVKTLSLTDVVIILSDMYSQSIDWEYMTEGQIEELSDKICASYSAKPYINSPKICADDVQYIKDYFKRHNIGAKLFTDRTNFFDKIALIIEKVPTNEYVDIFSCLWYNNSNIIRLYNRLFSILSKFDFAHSLYLPIDSVLHQMEARISIMSSISMMQLFEDSNECFTTDVYLKNNGNYEKYVSQIPKSEICAICKEVVFFIEPQYLHCTKQYDFAGIKDDVRYLLPYGGINMTTFEDNDLLDFPVLRYSVSEEKERFGLDDVLLRHFQGSKLFYLFDKYDQDLSISILLFCHHNGYNGILYLYKMLEEWVYNHIGKTEEERRRKIQETQLSPLFYIGTHFDWDLHFNPAREDTEESINWRWTRRLDTVVNKECFHTQSVDWVNNFDGIGRSFKNSYMLRNFKLSGPNYNGLYGGFEEIGREREMLVPKEYYYMLRKTFVENEYCKQFFENPALSFDVAASINNDGLTYILQNLAIAASNIGRIRSKDLIIQAENIASRINKIAEDMSDYNNVILK